MPKSQHAATPLVSGDRLESSSPSAAKEDLCIIRARRVSLRLLVGTGTVRISPKQRAAIDTSGAAIVTVAIRRTNIGRTHNQPNLLDVCRRRNSPSLSHGGLLYDR